MATRIVVPGELLAGVKERGENTYEENGSVYSEVLGLFYEDDGRVVPLNGPYLPRNEDYVVGIVKEIKFAGFTVDIKSPYDAFISAKDTRMKFELGDIVFGKLKDVDEVNNASMTQSKTLGKGDIVELSSVKIPRVIGKSSSMVNMIVKSTGSEIYVGKNGRIWIGGGDAILAARAIAKIEAEAHIPGLTERISAFLDSESKAVPKLNERGSD